MRKKGIALPSRPRKGNAEKSANRPALADQLADKEPIHFVRPAATILVPSPLYSGERGDNFLPLSLEVKFHAEV